MTGKRLNQRQGDKLSGGQGEWRFPNCNFDFELNHCELEFVTMASPNCVFPRDKVPYRS
jgi:hypothetical protein